MFCRTCLGQNCLVREKLEFKKGEDVLQEGEKFCYLGDMIIMVKHRMQRVQELVVRERS